VEPETKQFKMAGAGTKNI